MPDKSGGSTVVNNVSINTSVDGSKTGTAKSAGDSSSTSNNESSVLKSNGEIGALTDQFNELSKKVEAFSCCNQPFDLALGNYLESSLQQHQLTKRL